MYRSIQSVVLLLQQPVQNKWRQPASEVDLRFCARSRANAGWFTSMWVKPAALNISRSSSSPQTVPRTPGARPLFHG
jgi:hypothetical protein